MVIKKYALFFIFILLLFSKVNAAEDNVPILEDSALDAPPPKNFFIKSVSLPDGRIANDLYQIVQQSIPSNCKLKQVVDPNADFIVTGKIEKVETSPIYKNVNRLFVRVNVKALRTATNQVIAEFPEKNVVLEANESEQRKVYNISSELISNAASEVFYRICGLAVTND